MNRLRLFWLRLRHPVRHAKLVNGRMHVVPRVGELRIYNGEPEVLYPGEWSHIDADGLCTVSPEPGLRALLLRVRYRLIGRLDEWRAARKAVTNG